MAEFTATSGATVVIGVAPYEDVMELQSCIFEELAKSEIKLDLEEISRLKEKDTSELDFGRIMQAVMRVVGSRPIRKALMVCLAKSTYNGQKITIATFDEPSAREDYYEIVFQCVKVNLSPFFKPLVSKLSPLVQMMKSGPQK